jgi:hypothetical protein
MAASVLKEMTKLAIRFVSHGQNDRAFHSEETAFCRSDSLPSLTRRDADDVKKLATQLRESDGFRLQMKSAEDDGDTYSETVDKHVVSMATKDTAPCVVVSDLLTPDERGMQTASLM